MSLTNGQIDVILALEKTGASLSLVAVALILVTYCIFKSLRNIPNLFIVFASVANVGASIACVIGYDGLLKGESSALCQTQAFLLEMFMQSDPWWSLAMAVNVFLVFFCGISPSSFRRYLWLYCLICFGGPFIPAVSLLVARPNGEMIYGDATLWCWINGDWNVLRLYTYYIPIWICILFSALIYLAVGYHVFHQRNQLRNLTFSHSERSGKGDMRPETIRDSAEKDPTVRLEDWHVTAVTEVQITTVTQDDHGPESASPPTISRPIQSPPRTARSLSHKAPVGHQPRCHPSKEGDFNDRNNDGGSRSSSGDDDTHPRPHPHPHPALPTIRGAGAGGGGAYHAPTQSNSRFETMITSNPPPRQPRPPVVDRVRTGTAQFNSRLRGLDPIKLAYLRTSFIFAISILVTWTPSSINRVNDLVSPHGKSYGLNVATAVVLPLQGVWNAVIYFITSWETVREEWRGFRAARRGSSGSGGGVGGGGDEACVQQRFGGGGGDGGGARIEVFRDDEEEEAGFDGRFGGPRHVSGHGAADAFRLARFERGKRPGSDETSVLGLTGSGNTSNDNVRTIHGSF